MQAELEPVQWTLGANLEDIVEEQNEEAGTLKLIRKVKPATQHY